jgi:hypothetical protein
MLSGHYPVGMGFIVTRSKLMNGLSKIQNKDVLKLFSMGANLAKNLMENLKDG